MILLLFIVSSLSETIFSRTSDKIFLALRLSFLRIGSDMMTLHQSTTQVFEAVTVKAPSYNNMEGISLLLVLAFGCLFKRNHSVDS